MDSSNNHSHFSPTPTSLMHACLVAQLHPALCSPVDCNLPCSSVWDSPSKNIGAGGEGGIFLCSPVVETLSFYLWWVWVRFPVGELFLMVHGVVKKNKLGFLGGPVVNTLGFHARGYRFDSLRNQVPAMPCNVAKK